MKVENASFRASGGNVDDKVVALKKDAILAPKAIAKLGQQNVKQIPQPVQSAFPEH